MHSGSASILLLLLFVSSHQDTLRQHYEAAEAKRLAGQLKSAETEYRAILAEAYWKLGKTYSAGKRHKEAITALEAATGYLPESEDVLVDLAIAYFAAQQYDKAEEPLLRVLSRNPQSVGAHHMLGKTYFMRREFARSASELETALGLAPADFDVAYTLSLTYLRQRQFALAKQIYDRVLNQMGDGPQLRILFGRAYRQSGYLPEATEEFKKAVGLNPNYPRAHYYLGLAYLLSDGTARLAEAVEEFKVELDRNPGEFFANYFLGIVYIFQRKWDLAINVLQAASRIQPDNPDPYFHIGQAYQGIEKHGLAIEALNRAIALNPHLKHNDYQVTTAHYRLGQSLLKSGQTEAGQKQLQLASELKAEAFKKDKEFYTGAANSNEKESKFPGISSVEATAAESSTVDEKSRRELESGAVYYAKVIASAHNNIGLLRAEQEDFRAAAEQFILAAKSNPQQEGLNYNLGLAYFKLESYKDAIAALETELKAHSDNISARKLLVLSYHALAASLIKQGKHEIAERVIERMAASTGNSPQHADVIYQLGKAYLTDGRKAEGEKQLQLYERLKQQARKQQ